MKIYVIVDAQYDFIDGILGTEEAQEARDNIITYLNNNLNDNDIVFFTQDSHDSNYLKTMEGRNLPVPHCIIGGDGWKIDNTIISAARQKANHLGGMWKHTFGYLNIGKHIEPYISDCDEIIIMGFCTDICVIANTLILKSTFSETSISIVADCCAGTSIDKHNEALSVMESCQIDII